MSYAFLTLCLLAQFVSPGPALSSEATQHWQAAVEAEKQQHLEVAIAEFRKVTELEPTAAAGFVRLGSAYLEDHQYGEAVLALKRGLELAPDYPVAHQLLGYALLAQGYAAEAIPHLDAAHELGALGIAQIQTGQLAEAVSNLQAALRKAPNDPDLLYYLAQASEMLAQQSTATLLTAYPNSDRAHQARGRNYFVLRRLPEAEKEYREALALRPDIPGLHLELGQVYAETSQWAKAEEQFRAESKLQPGSAEAAYRLGDALLQEGEMPEAVKELRRSDRLRPDMSDTLYDLGKAASASGDIKAAETAWTRVLGIENDSLLAAQTHFALAGLYRKQGRTKEADSEMLEFHRAQERNSHAETSVR
jgi:tetratricopeptide (TPR) repeat protein